MQHPHTESGAEQLADILEGIVIAEDSHEHGSNQVEAPVAMTEEIVDLSPAELDALASPILCENIEDPLYQCINSHLPLSGGLRKPFRVHIR